MKLDDICTHCGALGSPDFLFGTKELREKCVHDGFECRPICNCCYEKGKTIVHRGKKTTLRREKKRGRRRRRSSRRSRRTSKVANKTICYA